VSFQDPLVDSDISRIEESFVSIFFQRRGESAQWGSQNLPFLARDCPRGQERPLVKVAVAADTDHDQATVLLGPGHNVGHGRPSQSHAYPGGKGAERVLKQGKLCLTWANGGY